MITTATAATKRPGRLFKLTSLFLCFFCLFVFLSFLYSFFFFLFDLVGCRQLVLIKWLRFLPNVLSSSRQAQSIRTILISILIRFHSPPPPWFFLVLLMMRNEVSGRGELFETDVTFSTLRSTPSLIVWEIGVSPHRSPWDSIESTERKERREIVCVCLCLSVYLREREREREGERGREKESQRERGEGRKREREKERGGPFSATVSVSIRGVISAKYWSLRAALYSPSSWNESEDLGQWVPTSAPLPGFLLIHSTIHGPIKGIHWLFRCPISQQWTRQCKHGHQHWTRRLSTIENGYLF